jgi:hypothetical protein
MEWIRDKGLKIIGVVLLVACVGWVNREAIAPYVPDNSFLHFSNLQSKEGVSAMIKSRTAKPPAYALHVLFIGNSFTFYHDIPQQLANIASSDPGNKTQLIIQSVTRGGIGLKELWQDGKAVQLIRKGPGDKRYWDDVVIQQFSNWAMRREWIDDTNDFAERFRDEITKSRARTLVYLTWVKRPYSHWYTDKGQEFMGNAEYMYNHFRDATHALADRLNAQPVDVGIYWYLVLGEEPDIDLYEADGTHPNSAGSYLSALVFYRTLTGRDVTQVTYKPGDVSEAVAARIRKVVAQ